MVELILIMHVFNKTIYFAFSEIIPPLMKEFLGNQNDTDITVMSAFRK